MTQSSPSPSPLTDDTGFAAAPTQRQPEGIHDALPPGTRFAEYELLSVVGEARFGIVYLALDHGLKRQVTIKEYLPASFASRGPGTEVVLRSDACAENFAHGLESFIDEARLLARFDHPALARVYRFWEANGTAYMAMPRYEGTTVGVARQVMGHPPDEAWLRDLLLPLLDALEVLHGASCYHRDISPENILLTPDGRPMLPDLGAARHSIGAPSQSSQGILDPGFAPIEQYAESPTVQQGPWTDLYALAAVAYYCIDGRPPMASTLRALDDRQEPLFHVVERLGRSFPHLNYSVAFISAIQRALKVRPHERPQSVAEFRRALLGGRGHAESDMPQSGVDAMGTRQASPPPGSSPEETGRFRDFADAVEAGTIERAFGEHHRQPPHDAPAPGMAAMEAQPGFAPAGTTPHTSDDEARDAAMWAALGPDPDRFARSQRGDAKAGGWRTALLASIAAVVLVALVAGGRLLWSEYREAKMVASFSARNTAPDSQPAPPVAPAPLTPTPPVASEGLATAPTERPANFPAPAPNNAQPAAQLPAAVAPEAPPDKPAAEDQLPVGEAPASPPVAERSRPSARIRADTKEESNNPRGVCDGPRGQFSLYRCMQAACERAKYYDHPECKYLRARDEVRQ